MCGGGGRGREEEEEEGEEEEGFISRVIGIVEEFGRFAGFCLICTGRLAISGSPVGYFFMRASCGGVLVSG